MVQMVQSDRQINSYRQDRLLNRLEQARNFLERRLETEPAYDELIATFDDLCDRLKSSSKLVAKIVSPTAAMASSLKAKSEDRLSSLYNLEAVSPIGNIRSILQHCDLICLLYLSHHEIRPHHRQLIESAQQEHVNLSILVSQSNHPEAKANLADWLAANYVDEKLLPLAEFIDLEDTAQLDLFERSPIDLAPTVWANRGMRIEREIEREIKRWFDRETNNSWQCIRDFRAEYLGGVYTSVYQQQLRQNISQVERFKQQLIREIKQEINYAKTALLNPFTTDSLIYQIQQLVDDAQISLVPVEDCTYLYLVLSHFPNKPYLHKYIGELCQQKTSEILVQQWSQIMTEYGSGGMESLRERLLQELKEIEVLLAADENTISKAIAIEAADFESIVEPECLEYNSRIIFDYSAIQSSWFRLFVSVLVGIGIYFATWLFSGTGRYIGFMIIIFQIISLITGQNIRHTKLKQQTKELKRLAERNYQSLVRIMVTHIGQTLTINLDRQCQQYQDEWQKAIASAQNKLDELKQSSDLYKTRVDRLNQDKDRLRDLLK